MQRHLVIAVGMALCWPAAAVADYSARADVGVGYSDNIRRTNVEPIEDEGIGTIGLNFDLHENTKRLTADATIDGDYMHYRDDVFADEFVGNADAALIVGLVPERFTWLLQDSYGQAQVDPFAPATPDTRENINYLTTGPDFVMNFGTRNAARLFGRYSLTSFERSQLDGDRAGGGIVLSHRTANSGLLALQGVQENIRYDDVPESDFDRRDALLTYELNGARTEFALEGGYTWIEMRQDESEISGPLLRVDLTRHTTESTRVIASFGMQFSDASQALRGSTAGPAMSGSPAGVAASPAPFENRFAELGWMFSRNRTQLAVRGSWSKDDYETQVSVAPQSDRTRKLYELSMSRRLSETFTAGFVGSLTDEDYDATGLTSEELRLVASLDWQFGRHLGVGLRAERFDRSSSDGATDYQENRGFFTLFYRISDSESR